MRQIFSSQNGFALGWVTFEIAVGVVKSSFDTVGDQLDFSMNKSHRR
jgi:hypothetical protein